MRGASTPGQPILSTPEINLENLRHPGRNGLLLVMVSLTWWRALTDDAAEWKRAVVDVANVLRSLCSTNSGASPTTDIDENVSTAVLTVSRKRKAAPNDSVVDAGETGGSVASRKRKAVATKSSSAVTRAPMTSRISRKVPTRRRS